ncbi:MAG TPA: DUF2203 domain-containing protein [Candidatus Saccharimonadales bacterium]|nr:DUF2203 domain-containing protein [Candidatus Saccharimonadales bacterium]
MEHRLFTVEEANEMLPQLEEIFARLDGMKERARQTQTQISILRLIWNEALKRPENPDHQEFLALTRSYQGVVEDTKELVREIQELGCLPKDLEQGLVDFYARREGRIVFLCWRRGEKQIRFWHELHAGYSGRVPL